MQSPDDDGSGGLPNPPDDTPDPGESSAGLALGVLQGTAFTAGTMTITPGSVPDGVSATVSLDVVNENNARFTGGNVSITFSSDCVANGTATINSPVSTNGTGRASATYTPSANCPSGADTITAAANFAGQALAASGDINVQVVRMGAFDNSTPPVFQEGVVAFGANPVATRGTSQIRVAFVDENDTLFTEQTIDVSFVSANCVPNGFASVDSPATTSQGRAQSTFTDQGCARGAVTSDQITANASLNGKALTATGTLQVQPASLGALEFVGADPTVIGIRGTGGQGVQETSTVTFRLRDRVGDPVDGGEVTFALNFETGGIQLSDTRNFTNSEGLVSVVVSSGSVHTTVRVNAEATDPNTGTVIRSQSDQLVITSGIPTQDGSSITATCFNLEAFDYDNVTTDVNFRMADRFGNPVPEGTAVAFTTEAGSVDGQCFTDATGGCTVQWRSQGTRPVDGRTTVLATAIGEESFSDANGNGLHDAGEQNAALQDLEEAFLDRDEDGLYDPNGFGANGRQTENRAFTAIAADSNVDFDNDGAHDAASGSFTGLLCDSGCDDPNNDTTLSVRDDIVLIFSGSGAVLDALTVNDQDGQNDARIIDPDVFDGQDPIEWDGQVDLGELPNDPGTIVGSAFLSFVLRDARGQPMPEGTTIALETDVGTVEGISSYEVLCTTNDTIGGNAYGFTIKAPDLSEVDSGSVRLTSTTPRGVITQYSLAVRFVPPPPVPAASLQFNNTPIDEAGGVGQIRVVLDIPAPRDVTVELAVGGTAERGVDYDLATTTIVIPADQNAGSIDVTAIDDAAVEGDETIVVEIQTVENGVEDGDQQQTGIITDDDD